MGNISTTKLAALEDELSIYRELTARLIEENEKLKRKLELRERQVRSTGVDEQGMVMLNAPQWEMGQ